MAGGPMVNMLIAFFVLLGRLHAATANPSEALTRAGRRGHRLRHPGRRRGRRLQAQDPVSAGADGRVPAPATQIVSFNGTPMTDWDQLSAR